MHRVININVQYEFKFPYLNTPRRSVEYFSIHLAPPIHTRREISAVLRLSKAPTQRFQQKDGNFLCSSNDDVELRRLWLPQAKRTFKHFSQSERAEVARSDIRERSTPSVWYWEQCEVEKIEDCIVIILLLLVSLTLNVIHII